MIRHTDLGLAELLVLCLLAGTVVGVALGGVGPVAYVETGSMEPTLSPGDGFLVVPGAFAPDPRDGDVVVFRSLRTDGPEFVTHRVVGTTAAGYLTRGDANPFVDQSGDEPVVTPDRIVGVAPAVAGQLLVVPGLGDLVDSAVGAVPALRILVVVALVGVVGHALFASERRSYDRKRTPRDRGLDPRRLVLFVAAIVAVVSLLAMVVPAGTHQLSVVDGTVDGTYTATNAGLLPVVTVLETTSGVAAADPVIVVPARGEASTAVQSVATVAGDHATLTEHRYLAVLPTGAVLALHALHPWLALGSVAAVPTTAFLVAGLLLAGNRRLRDTRRATGRRRRARQ